MVNLNASHYAPLIDKILIKVASWKSHFSSAGGKLILIKLVLNSMLQKKRSLTTFSHNFYVPFLGKLRRA